MSERARADVRLPWSLRALSALLVSACLAGCGDDKSDAAQDAQVDPGADVADVADVNADAALDADTEEDTGPRAPSLSEAQRAAIATLSAETMRMDVDTLAADELGGRMPGSPGHEVARDYIADRMQEIGLTPFGDGDSFVQAYPTEQLPRGDYMLDADGQVVRRGVVSTGYNLVGLIPGSDPDLADEYMVLMAHYDHLGVDEDGVVFNGAFDNASGVALALEVARVLLEDGAAPARSLIVLVTDEEEGGLNGAEQWIAVPPVRPDDILFGVSADPVGRRILPDYGAILLSGFERSPGLLELWRETAEFAESDVIFIHRGAIPVFHSDQDEFHGADLPVPAAWFINPGMSFYHTTDDTADTVDYRMLLDSARYLASCFAYAGSTDARWEYEGAPEIGAAAAAEFKRLAEGMLTSEVLTESQRERVQGIIDDTDAIIAADSMDAVGNPNGWLTETVMFLAFQLPREHPGAVPPPFPGDE